VEQGGGKATTIAFALSYRGKDPETVANVANALATSYVEQNSKIRERQAAGTTQFLKAQLADMKKKLDEQERHLGELPTTPEAEAATTAAAPAAPVRAAKNPLADVDAELKALRDEERNLRVSVSAYEQRVQNMPRRMQDFQRQARDYATTKEMYASLLKRYED